LEYCIFPFVCPRLPASRESRIGSVTRLLVGVAARLRRTALRREAALPPRSLSSPVSLAIFFASSTVCAVPEQNSAAILRKIASDHPVARHMKMPHRSDLAFIVWG